MINTNPTTISGTFQQGVNGLQNSSRSMLESANELVRSGTVDRAVSTTDIVEPLLNIYQQQHLFDASAKVIKVADETLGALIDIKT